MNRLCQPRNPAIPQPEPPADLQVNEEEDGFEDIPDHDGLMVARRRPHRGLRVPPPLTPVRRPLPHRVRFSPPGISPFMRRAPEIVVAVLEIRFFGHTYPVEITRRLDISGTMKILKEQLRQNWDDGMWDSIGLAGNETGNAWSEGEWDDLKQEWIKKKGHRATAWVVMM